ncbi:Amidophosphoribosyltransferase [Leadbetterella byssophila DSM 17132]|jgi:amidophosphoribosyltransferase|uniref:Amidophosphoribosyltransferase n=1 Tax=Leadbetterella byssophila (strain DSM 17132 / JCM 16389 / KACC 11308 / NBRC 106382 / 4M15) TaxID=649349 RepID=E4RT01_LEAB4|nr:amidophosphoribosyltransferase [Leadbetterella byssophila]ADQ17709.1 Amidophosphoribosyltransferase [Leadbetterella byssophila DSM 17132]
MSDSIKHECGIAMIRLRKPLEYYIQKYGTPLYAINRLYVLMEKQSNRGQDGAGVANVKIEVPPGSRYISRYRSVENRPVVDIFKKINEKFIEVQKQDPSLLKNSDWLQKNIAFTGEVWLGHLRYGTHGKNEIENCHPMLRQSNWRSRNLVVAGNFNMTNADELFKKLVDLGQHPKDTGDTITVLEKIGHFLDEENQRIFDKFKGQYENPELSDVIEDNMDMQRVLHRACRDFDGGYAMAGITGFGAAFVVRDPAGIRPAYYWYDDEVVVVASERVAIKAAFGAKYNDILEITPGNALIINKNGDFAEHNVLPRLEKKSCSFERIYFSRGSDPNIYSERKELGRRLIPQILKEINYDLENTVFSYIPNTAEPAFYGMVEGIEQYLTTWRKERIQSGSLSEEELEKVLDFKPRFEKLVSKDVKLRTFITNDDDRSEMVSHVYEMTHGVIRKKTDTLVIIDDSIVRGTTLEKSILKLLDKLGPKKIVIVSSAPQIRYPDCYGIDMSKVKEFVAFRAMLALLDERGLSDMKEEVYQRILAMDDLRKENLVKDLFAQFTDDEISKKISEIIAPKDIEAEVSVVFQTVENLNAACPQHLGDWYFTGNYPTPGGNKVVNRAFVNFMEGKYVRAY